MSRYNFKETESKWQRVWTERRCFEAREDSDRPKYYALEMFPYPSGRIHMGHVRNYTLGDVVARYKRARGFNVLHPMGWDSFGLPAENAAMENKVHPAKWTRENIAAMRAQFQSMGLSLDWSRELSTCEPNYYRHGQHIFLDFLEAGLAYQRESWVNWDPVENSVLANEQVIDGKGWRTGAPVEKRLLKQWFLKITEFSDALLEGLETLERWPEKVRLMQHNWIGRSEGAHIQFQLKERSDRLEVFTTRPDTLFGASFCAIAANHPLAQSLAKNDPLLKDFIAECNRMGTSEEVLETAEKRGRDTGLKALHPFVAGKELPVYVANFVLMEYGTGAIFGCPGHDQRDLDFARKYGLPVVPVVAPRDIDPATFTIGDTAYVEDGVVINSDFLNGLDVPAAKRAAIDRLAAQGDGQSAITYRLRDWGVSRQRYWGCPIPVIHCPSCGVVPVPVKDLPVLLPDDVTFDAPGNPLARHPTWKNVSQVSVSRSRAIPHGKMSPVRPAAARPSVRPTPATHSSIRPGISCAIARRKTPTSRLRAPRSTIGCRLISISVGSNTPSCTCCIPASSRGRCGAAVSSVSTSLSPACSPKAWSVTRPIATRRAAGSFPPRLRPATAVLSSTPRQAIRSCADARRK